MGIILGEPTGLAGKLWLSHNTAVDGAVAWSFSDEDALHLHADFLVHNLKLIAVDKGLLAVHFGIGGRLKFEDDSRFGARIPVGMTYIFEGAPLDAFLEVVPILDLVPDTEFNPNAAIGIRYFFGSTNRYQGNGTQRTP
jgi:hypothetical protein